jgi:hypothetical protein
MREAGIFFFGGGGGFVRRVIFNEARRFGSRPCLRLQEGKTPTLVDSLDSSVLKGPPVEAFLNTDPAGGAIA